MISKKLIFMSTVLVTIGLLFLIGCSGSNETADAVQTEVAAVADEHAGHDHGPDVEHGTPAESNQETLDWCAEHAVPESVCTQCNPNLIGSFKESGDWCGGHDIPESHCRLCNPGIKFPQEELLRSLASNNTENEIAVSLLFRPNQDICATNDALIQFASASTAERAGISIEVARAGTFDATISAPAEIVFDESKSVHVTSTVNALLSQWMKSPGDSVYEGEVLAILQSPEIAQLKSSLVSLFASYEVQRKELNRHKELRSRNLISEADYDYQEAITEQARAEMISVEGLLLSAGLIRNDIENVKKHGSMGNRFALRAPSTGLLVERIAQLGELLEAGRSFAMLADPQSMWIEANLTEAQLRSVSKGQEMYFSSDGRGLNSSGGEIIWISRFLDPHTRTGTVRAKVLNTEHQLQAGEFGRVSIPIHGSNSVTLVSKDAVQWEGCCNVVFVKESSDRFRPRKVKLQNSEGPYYQITDGLMQGEEIVVDGAFLLKTELKKSSIGAGCCGIEPVG